jgi:hypothetical protein
LFNKNELDNFRELWEKKERFDVLIGNTLLFIDFTKDGIILGFKEKRLKADSEDHVVIIFDNNKNISTVHRTVIGDELTQYSHIDWQYIGRYSRVLKLFNDLTSTEAGKPFQQILPIMYFLMNYVIKMAERCEYKFLTKEEAIKLGISKYPVFVVTFKNRLDRVVYNIIIKQLPIMNKNYFVRTREQKTPGLVTTRKIISSKTE